MCWIYFVLIGNVNLWVRVFYEIYIKKVSLILEIWGCLKICKWFYRNLNSVVKYNKNLLNVLYDFNLLSY